MSRAHEEPRIFQPGDRVGNYVVVEFIGSGACGQVYAVDHVFTGDRFALKVGHLKDRKNLKKAARSIAEARAVYQLQHPNIVRVVDLALEDSGMVWQIMELLRGQSVGQLITAHGRLSPLFAIEIVLDVACALQAAHERQIIHRDIHPWNIFVTAKGRVVVLDFSLAKVMHSNIETTRGERSAMGTTAYMSPEHIRQAPASPQFDVFGLGITLWQMLVGRHPFEAALGNMFSLVERQLKEDPESLVTAAGLPAYCDEVIRRATARDPRERYEGMWPLVQALQNLYQRLEADPAAPAAVWEPPAWEERWALGQESRSQYRPPRSLPRKSPAPAVPSARLVVSPAVAKLPIAASIAATIPMAVVDLSPTPAASSAAKVAPATVRGRAQNPAARRRRWALLVAVPVLMGLGAGLWLLATWDASAAPTRAAVAPRAPTASAPAEPRRPPAPRPKR
jgi:serine/threonine-protein kinase